MLKNLAQHLLFQVSTWFSSNTLFQSDFPPSILPFYHGVSDHAPPHVRHLYPFKTHQDFEADLDFLTKHFNPLSIKEFIAICNNEQKLKEPKFLLSFDDGLKEVAENIAPILKRRNLPAIFFINPAFVDNQTMFYRFKSSLLIDAMATNPSVEVPIKSYLKTMGYKVNNLKKFIHNRGSHEESLLDQIAPYANIDFNEYLREHPPFMNLTELKNMEQQGFALGAHSWDHPYYQELALEAQVKQTQQSMDWMADRFPTNYRLFAFPYSDLGVTSAFYQQAFKPPLSLDATFGKSGFKIDTINNHFQRIPMEEPQGQSILNYQIIKHQLTKRLKG